MLNPRNYLLFKTIICFFFYSNISNSQTWTLPCIDDALVRISNSGSCPAWQTTNFGTTSNELKMHYWTYAGSGCAGAGTQRSYVKFNITLPNNNQQMYDGRATLNLYTFPSFTHWWQGTATDNPIYINRVTSNWSENTITWNTQPTTTVTGQITVPTTTNNSTANLQADISTFFNDWECGINSNEGLGLQLINESQLYRSRNYCSKEHANAALHPTITVEYATINATAIDTICFGDSIPLLACSLTNAAIPSGYNFQWQHLNTATNYLTQNVVKPIYSPGLNTYVVTVTNPYCQTGYDTVQVYVINSSSSNANPIICSNNTYTLPSGAVVNTTGTYSDTLLSFLGCDSIITTNLIVNPTATSSANPVICSNSTYTLPGGAVVSIAGIYNDTLISVITNCDSIITTNLSVNPVVTSNANPVICSNSNYTLPDGSIVNTAGTYLDTLTNINGCDSVITTNLIVNPVVASSANTVICSNSNYTLPDGSIVNTAGTYMDTLTNINGCDSIITTNLSVNPVVASSANPVICSNSTYTLPGGTTVNTAGTYIDTLTNINGCDSIITTNLIVNPVVTSNANPVICSNSTYTLPGGTTVNTAGTYIDTLTNINGCDSIITTNLSLNNVINVNQNISLCQGNTHTLPGGNIVGSPGIYIDTLIAIGGCDSIITTTIIVNPIANITFSPTICQGDTYTLPNGNITSLSGTYIDTLSTIKGCDSIITTNLSYFISPVANITGNNTIYSGQSTNITATGGVTYSWSPSTGLNTTTGATITATPNQTTTYCVEITDNNGCKDSSCITITVESPCAYTENIKIANAFSPNSDNNNDIFCIEGLVTCVEDFTISIYNRWGEKVFESKDPSVCWDGTYKGKSMDSQVFVYIINVQFINTDFTKLLQGNISLIR